MSDQYIDDTKSIESIINALYEVISGEAGEERDWIRNNNLFWPGTNYTVIKANDKGKNVPTSISLDEFENWFITDLKNFSFYEYEINQVVEQYGSICHVFSTYESRYSMDGEILKRGINSIQLYYDQERWWIVNIFWERDGDLPPIPEKYLPS